MCSVALGLGHNHILKIYLIPKKYICNKLQIVFEHYRGVGKAIEYSYRRDLVLFTIREQLSINGIDPKSQQVIKHDLSYILVRKCQVSLQIVHVYNKQVLEH